MLPLSCLISFLISAFGLPHSRKSPTLCSLIFFSKPKTQQTQFLPLKTNQASILSDSKGFCQENLLRYIIYLTYIISYVYYLIISNIYDVGWLGFGARNWGKLKLKWWKGKGSEEEHHKVSNCPLWWEFEMKSKLGQIYIYIYV